MDKIKSVLKNKFLNADGTINKSTLVSFITLLIVLVNEVLSAFNVTPTHEDQVVAIINTILTILGLLGFVEGGANDQSKVVASIDTKPELHHSVQTVSTAEIKALTSLASQAQHIQDEQIASVSASVLAENNKSLSSERDKQ